MATLSELAKTQQTTTVGGAQSGSVGSAGGTSIQPTQIIDKSAGLAKDIGKMFGGLLQEHQQASEYAGKRVGTDNLVSYKQEMGKIADMYASKADVTSSDMIEKSRLEQGVYEEFLQKGTFADNPLANQAFRDTYADPAADHVLRLKKTNSDKQVALFKDETKRDVSFSVGALGSDINAENIKTFKQQYSDAGLDPVAVDGLVLNAASDSLTVEVNNNHSLYYDAGGNINTEAVDAMFKDKYKHYVGSDNKAIVAELSKTKETMDTFLKGKANQARVEYTNQAMNRGRSLTWDGQPYTDENGITYKFASNYKEFEKTVSEEFPLLTTENHTQVMNLYRTKKSSKDGMNSLATKYMASTKFNLIDKKFPSGQPIDKKTIKEYASWNNTIQTMAKQGLISESKAIAAEFRQKTLQRQYDNQQTIFNDMGVNNTETLIKKSEVGGTNPNGETITGNEYMKQYKITEDNIAQVVDSIDTDTIDVKTAGGVRQELTKRFDASVRYAQAQGKNRPALFNRYDASISDVSGTPKAVEEMQKMLQYIEYSKANGNNKYYAYDKELNQLKQVLYKTDADGKLLPKEERAQRASIIMQSMATDIYRNTNSKESLRTAVKAVNEIATGESRYFTSIDTPVPQGTAQNIMKLYKGSADELSIKQEVESYEYYDAGGTTGFDKSRVAIPKGLDKPKFGRYVNTILKVYNTNREDKLDAGDVEFVVGNDGTDLTYRILDRTTQRHIGNISTNGYQFLLGTGEMSDTDTRDSQAVLNNKKQGLFLGD